MRASRSDKSNHTDVKQSLCEAMCLLMEDHSRKKITVSMLIDKAGVCRSSFYYYFGYIDDVFSEMIENFCNKYLPAVFQLLNCKATKQTEELLKAEEALFCIILQHKKQLQLFFNDENYLYFKKHFFSDFTAYCQNISVTISSSDSKISSIQNRTVYDYTVRGCCAQIFSFLELLVKSDFRETPTDFIEIYRQTFSSTIHFNLTID